MNLKTRLGGVGVLACMLFAEGCMVGPNYKRPAAPVPATYKEPPTSNFKEAGGWKPASPNDAQLKGKWWEIYNDPALNILEEQVAVSNQNVLALEAQYREARDATRVARAALFPTVGTSPAITESRSGGSSSVSSLRTAYSFPLSASWAPDLWGSVRRNITAVSATAQATAAQLENARLLYQSELAQDYFLLHGLDTQYELLDRNVNSYQEYLTLTRNRFTGGVASDLDVAEAESQLYTTQASLQDLGVLRAQYEHAIAVLTGRPPAELTIPALVIKNPPPVVPINVPSALLERRPDIAASERQMASANEQVGIATAAFYPSLSLGASVGLQNSGILQWFTWPSRFFSIGPSLSETIFDAGRRRAVLAETKDFFDVTVADYRQTVLTAFQQVEDNLAALRVMADESITVDLAVSSSARALTVSTAQYKAGTTSFLTVITAQATALNAERTAVQLLTRRLTASVALVQALGGGWDASQLPSMKDVQSKTR
ncbi:MAG TPA: efflux transporter outer membrane subunit [Candidatus Sulfopaludibacter sp.]|jgi:NodT family efflux transporter outer membrane factor (OMF) lipoprotein|nr:efflux transporter outer membrane subunit [Candidatus Sulfopaludibacter sp.]